MQGRGLHHTLQGRELGQRAPLPQLPRPNSGILVLDDTVSEGGLTFGNCSLHVRPDGCCRCRAEGAAAGCHPTALPSWLQHAGLPGGVLTHVEGTVHYLDLAGLQARSLRDFGEPSRCGSYHAAQPPRGAVRRLGLRPAGAAGVQRSLPAQPVSWECWFWIGWRLLSAEQAGRAPMLPPPALSPPITVETVVDLRQAWVDVSAVHTAVWSRPSLLGA